MKRIVNHLKYLKKLNVVAVKQSLEDEGASFDDLKIMRRITRKAGLELNVKIGGCEAKNDMYFCEKLNVNAVVAPMVESDYALRKFIQIVSKNNRQDLYVNLESIQAFNNIKKIMNSKSFRKLKGVVIGRSDLAGSINLEKSAVDSNKIYKLVLHLSKKIKKRKMVVNMGGSLTQRSVNFIRKLFKKKLLDRVETRNVVIKLSDKVLDNFESLIINAFKFEIDWMKFKQKRLKSKKFKLKNDSSLRIQVLKRRLDSFQNG